MQPTDQKNADTNSTCAENQGEQVQRLYTDLALPPATDFGWRTGKANADELGYAGEWLEQIPDVVWECSAAVGNVFSIGPIYAGETVIDLGCGAGADLCIAARFVGHTGRVLGIDLTPAMVEKAREKATRMQLPNFEIHVGDISKLPVADAIADVVISNGAINLSPDKPGVIGEAFRALKQGGSLSPIKLMNVVADGALLARLCSLVARL